MEAIVAEYETPLLRYAARILNNPAAAQDVVQNTFIKLFRGWKPGMHASPSLKSWLYRVTHNEAVDYIRRESRLQLLHEKQASDQAIPICTDGCNCPLTEPEKHEAVPPAQGEQTQEREERGGREVAGAPHERPSSHHAFAGLGVGVHEDGL